MNESVWAMRIAVQHGADGTGDLERVGVLAGAAAGERAELLVLPQLFLAGHGDPRAIRARAELSDGPAARRLGQIAREHRIAILCGYAELCTGRVHDAALFVDARGQALANYRRTHLVPEADEPAFAPGQWLTIVPLGELRLGILLGTDLEGPETARALALAGAHLLLVGARHGPDQAAVAALLPARAAENRCGLAYANGDARPGAPPSCLVAPDGQVLAASAGGLAVATVPGPDPAQALARDLLRRPRLYQRLVAPMPGEDAPRL